MRPIIHKDMLRQHCRALVLTKECDDARMNRAGPRGPIGIASATWPNTWLLIQLGLWNWWARGGASTETAVGEAPEPVDPWQVASGTVASHKSYYDDAAITVETAMKINHVEHHDRARYTQLHPLPLYWAGEGKNRVFLFRMVDMPIQADVKRLHLPRPDEMAIGSIGVGSLKLWILDAGGFLDVIHGPRHVLPIWESYGVSRRFKFPLRRAREALGRWREQRDRLRNEILFD